MEITEVRIKLMEDPQERLQAFCSITFNGSFVIRDLKIIQGTKGSFVAMPSRKLTDRCPRCHCKNQLRAMYCNQCGVQLDEERATKDTDGRAKLYADIAHPINSSCREMIQEKVVEAFEEELIRAKKSGYVCMYDDYGEERFASLNESVENAIDVPQQPQIVQGKEGKTHRIDPAAETPAESPHQQQSIPGSQQRQSIKVSKNEEHFGDGLLS